MIISHRLALDSYQRIQMGLTNLCRKFLPVLAIPGILLFSACIQDAPRNNPLDPDNPDYHYTKVNGYLRTASIPNHPISNVEVLWRPENRIALTDTSGYFALDDLVPHDGWLTFRHSDFLTDSIFINWSSSSKTIEHNLYLQPKVDSLVFYSCILNRYPDRQNLELVVKTKIRDPDKIIDTVSINSQKLVTPLVLNYDLNTALYMRKIISNYLIIDNPAEIIGHEFWLGAEDKLTHHLNLQSASIKRIIDAIIEPLEPISYDTVSSMPTLKWSSATVAYPAMILIEIYTDEMQLAWSKSGLPINSTSITVETGLAPDTYKWAVWIIDEFQNQARSRLKNFVVK